jgi:hypothetical protein
VGAFLVKRRLQGQLRQRAQRFGLSAPSASLCSLGPFTDHEAAAGLSEGQEAAAW